MGAGRRSVIGMTTAIAAAWAMLVGAPLSAMPDPPAPSPAELDGGAGAAGETPTATVDAWSAYDASIADARAAMMSAPADALAVAQAAEATARSLGATPDRKDALATSLWLQAEAAFRLNRLADVAPLVEKAEAEIVETASQLAGDLLLTKARLARAMGDYGLALDAFQRAHQAFADIDSVRSEAIALQGLGTVFDAARRYERVIEYNEHAAAVFSDDGSLDLTSLNNRANALRELGRHSEALPLLERALEMARAAESPVLTTRILTNIAMLHLHRGALRDAAASIAAARNEAEAPSATGWRVYIGGVAAQLALERGDLDAAEAEIRSVFDGMDIASTSADFRDFHAAAYRIYKLRGSVEEALAHLERFKELDDQGREVAANANQAILNAEFDFANQALEIETLQREQLETEFALSQSRERQRRVATYAALALAAIVVGFLTLAIVSGHRTQRMTAALNAELAAKNAELETNNAALARANQAKLQFLATTSHEIRTPLNAIIGLTDVVLAGDALTPRDAEYLRTVNTSGKSLLAIVNDILDISRLEAGRVVVDAKPADVDEAVEAVASLWRRSAEEKSLDFELDIERFDTRIVTDDRLLRQVTSHLISNAIKFTKTGGVRVSLRCWSGPAGDAAAGLELSVADTGVGIADDAREIIFEAFRQEDGSARRNFGGVGLGLAIVKRVVEAMQGEISLDSVVGEGSVFTVRLPGLAAAQARSSADGPTNPEATVAPPRSIAEFDVLLVEDNPANAMVLKALLKSKVKSIELAENGAICMEKISARAFDLVLMDKQMPVMDGLEAIRRIRQLDGPIRNVPIIAVTADVFPGAREELIEAGADDYVSKPVQLPLVLRTIDATLARRAGDDEPAKIAAAS